jgi:hypothetical protein
MNAAGEEAAEEADDSAATPPPWERGSLERQKSWRSKLKARLKADLAVAGAHTRGALASLRAALPAASSPAQPAAAGSLREEPLSPRLSVTQLLAAPHADLRALRAVVSAVGCDDCAPGLRIAAWRLLLGVDHPELAVRATQAAAQRDNYCRLVRELVLEPSAAGGPDDACCGGAGGGGGASLGGRVRGELPAAPLAGDHPLATESDSVWHRHFRDAELRDQIGRDVERTQRNMHWFSAEGAEEHRAAQSRVLFIFAATNKGVRYVQGMNELLAPLYYLCATAPAAAAAADAGGAEPSPAEADAFHCFVPLMSELRDLFCATLDGSGEGVAGTLARLSSLLRLQDGPLWRHLEVRCGVNPQFYAFRWITTAFTQEFLLPDTLRLWDYAFGAADGPREALLRVAAAMVLAQRDSIMAADFATTLKMLQAYPPTDVGAILRRAAALPPAPPAAGTGPVSGLLPADDAGEEEGWDRVKAAAAAARAAVAWRGGGGGGSGGLGWRLNGVMSAGAGGGGGGGGSDSAVAGTPLRQMGDLPGSFAVPATAAEEEDDEMANPWAEVAAERAE